MYNLKKFFVDVIYQNDRNLLGCRDLKKNEWVLSFFNCFYFDASASI